MFSLYLFYIDLLKDNTQSFQWKFFLLQIFFSVYFLYDLQVQIHSLSNLLLHIHVNSCMDLIQSHSNTHILTNTKIYVCKCGLTRNTCVHNRGKGTVHIKFLQSLLGSFWAEVTCLLCPVVVDVVWDLFSHYFVSLLISHRQNSWISQSPVSLCRPLVHPVLFSVFLLLYLLANLFLFSLQSIICMKAHRWRSLPKHFKCKRRHFRDLIWMHTVLKGFFVCLFLFCFLSSSIMAFYNAYLFLYMRWCQRLKSSTKGNGRFWCSDEMYTLLSVYLQHIGLLCKPEWFQQVLSSSCFVDNTIWWRLGKNIIMPKQVDFFLSTIKWLDAGGRRMGVGLKACGIPP